jgi:hypothetical protein
MAPYPQPAMNEAATSAIGAMPSRHDVAARMTGQPIPHELVRVRAPTIPDEGERPAHVACAMVKETQDLGPANVQAWVQGRGQGVTSRRIVTP